MTFEQLARSFGAVADAYEHGRPAYPDAAAAAVVPDGARLVVDVGAGTGKFTRTLVGRAEDVIAVEPDAAMRQRLAAVLPDVRALDGSGESIPLPDGSADAVTFAQAWHWVDPVRGTAEVARVLRPGGVLGLVWNLRDVTEPWSAQLSALLRPVESRRGDSGGPTAGPPFREAGREAFPWVHEQDRSAFLDMIATRSHVIVLPAAERTALLDAVQRLLDTDSATAGRETVPVPYTTHVRRFVRP